MTALQLVLTTIILPGAWGWIVGSCGHRWWKVSEHRTPPMSGSASRRPTDYEI
jgi:hypothetical protein